MYQYNSMYVLNLIELGFCEYVLNTKNNNITTFWRSGNVICLRKKKPAK